LSNPFTASTEVRGDGSLKTAADSFDDRSSG